MFKGVNKATLLKGLGLLFNIGGMLVLSKADEIANKNTLAELVKNYKK